MALASGAAVANLYYNQPMLAQMGRTVRGSPNQIGLVATATQIGYAAGMPLFIPLGDFIERRRLIVLLFVAVSCALVATATAANLTWLVIASFLVGLTTVIAQIMIPLASDLAAPEQQGRIVGTILSGVLLGALLARTLSGFVSEHLSWRAMYWIAAAASLVLAAVLQLRLPQIHPEANMRYPQLMRSIWAIVVDVPKLRQVSIIAGLFFAAFSAFWTTLVFLLETPPYHYRSQAAGLFGVVGAVGAGVAPLAGKFSDRRSPRLVVSIAIFVVLVAFAVFWCWGFRLWGLVLGVILLDAGVQAAQVANQSRVLSLKPEARNRVNTVYMICYFGGGSSARCSVLPCGASGTGPVSAPLDSPS
jgi:predicted MFS family arabinose efflux permease